MKIRFHIVVALLFTSLIHAAENPIHWPKVESQHKPWTRWWWHGNAVDSAEIARHLKEFDRVGIGGVEITSIYGVQDQEEQEIPYLSEAYIEILNFTSEKANALKLGVDIPPGSGWRCGGPELDIKYADARVIFQIDTLAENQAYRRTFEQTPQALMAFSETGEKVDLQRFISNDAILWQPPSGTWHIYVVTQKWSGAKVKRPAPGGEGYSFNPYSQTSTEQMLKPFTRAFQDLENKNIRAIFHDSFEYTGNWTTDFFAEFANRRGYDLREYLPELTGHGDAEIIRRVKCDYRETISDLVLEDFIRPLKSWSNDRGWLLRNQSHGSPANLLDLYGEVDIPETEIFRFDHDPRVLKFASSAAHTTGKTLVSSESFTWQDEHFQVTLDTMKRSADLLFASGINHIFFHGTTYSPQNADWPGWLFYASSQINPQNTIWRDLPAFNDYITRCQSMLQTSTADNDVLIYWPVYDVWSDPEGLDKKLAVHHAQWITENPAGMAAQELAAVGLGYDFISDAQILTAHAVEGSIVLGSTVYQTLVVPHCEFIPVETMRTIFELAQNGATILLPHQSPKKAPGLFQWQSRQKTLSEMLVALKPNEDDVCNIGDGQIVLFEDLVKATAEINLKREPFAKFPKMMWLRKRHASGSVYFLSNQGATSINEWLTLARPFESLAIYDPMTGDFGKAASRNNSSIYLQLDAGESLLLKTFDINIDGPAWHYWQNTGESYQITGDWHIKFVDGGPVLPSSITAPSLTSWTQFNDPECNRFAGTARYRITFDAPLQDHQSYLLDLGRVAESAEILLNGKAMGTRFSHPYTATVKLAPKNNILEVFVTNLAANRIRDLDRRDVEWRIFDDINFVNIDYQTFDASEWPLRESGLLGPVTLTPITPLEL